MTTIEITPTGYFCKNTWINCVFKDFYASGTQDAEVTQSLVYEKNSLTSKKHKAKVFNTSLPR